MRKKKTDCALCGTYSETTREHFVPKCLWPGPRPSDTKTIPSCSTCNEGCSVDDEYFRNVIAIEASAWGQTAHDVFKGAVLRGFQKNKKQAIALLSTARRETQALPSGILLPNRVSILAQGARIDRSFTKILRGLYFNHADNALTGTTLLMDQGDEENMRAAYALLEGMSPIQSFGDEVFEWRCQSGLLFEDSILWAFRFYRSRWYFGVTREAHSPATEENASEIIGEPIKMN